MNKKLNLWFFIIMAALLAIFAMLDMALSFDIPSIMYITLAGPTIAAIGNYMVIVIATKKRKKADRITW